VALYHKGQFDFSETPLGKIYEIALDEISTSLTDKMYELKPDGRATGITGKVSFIINVAYQFKSA